MIASLLHSFFRKPSSFELALQKVNISEYHKTMLEKRYSKIVREMRSRARRLAFFFHLSRTMITVGSLLVPALLSVQSPTSGSPHAIIIYWSTWVISLLVSMFNALIALVKLDKRYYLVHTTLELLVSEGWQFLELTGKYSGFYTPGLQPTHENQFIFFCHSVEKIRMRQIEEEYYKLSELHMQNTGTAGGTGTGTNITRTSNSITSSVPATGSTVLPATISSAIPLSSSSADLPFSNLIPPTPLQGELARLPQEVLRAVQEQLSRSQIEDGTSSSSQYPPSVAATGSAIIAASTASTQENTESTAYRANSSVPM